MATSIMKKMNQLEITSTSKSLSVPASDYGGTTITVTKSGYYPLAIAGFNITGSGASGTPVIKAIIASRAEGTCDVTIGARNVTTTARSLTATVNVLWQKI